MDRDTITALTIAVRVYRQLRAMGIYDMPIKWNITAKAMKARGLMDQISTEYDGFIETGSEHLSDVKGLRSQVGDMQDDLQAAANVMGNDSRNGNSPAVSGNGAAEKPKERPIEKKVTEAGEVWTITLDADAVRGKPAERPNIEATDSAANQPKATAEPPLVRLGPNPSQQEAGETPATTFQGIEGARSGNDL